MNDPALVAQLIRLLRERKASIPGTSVVVGFDGFVDEVWQLVDRRESPDTCTHVRSIADFAAWARASAGRSGSRESILAECAPGGCSVNLGDGLLSLGFSVHAFAGLGNPPHPAFTDFSSRCASYESIEIEPGRTTVFEFEDGKLMFCSCSHFGTFTPEHLRQGGYARLLRAKVAPAHAVALTSWSVYPHMNECWQFLQQEALVNLPNRPLIFLDLADPASRAPEDLRQMMTQLSGFEKIGPTVLSLNLNEALRVAAAAGIATGRTQPEDCKDLAVSLRELTSISEVGIHLVDQAVSASAAGVFHVFGPHCPQPKKSVGAGDRFNAGWLSAHLLDLPPAEALLFASAVSGFFVRNARSPDFDEAVSFLQEWLSAPLEAQLSS